MSEPEVKQRQKERQRQYQERQQVFGLAFVEAANFAIRYNARIKSFYQRKKAKSHGVLAIKAVAHKLCRACYYIMRDQVAFDVAKAFA